MKKAVFISILFLLLSPFSTRCQELKIYRLSTAEKYPEGHINPGFISLTDEYPWNDKADSSLIADKFLGNVPENGRNYHVLSRLRRTRFLNSVGVSEADRVFIYRYEVDSIYSFDVRELPLVAVLDPYEKHSPLRQRDYMIGFELDSTRLKWKDHFFYNNFIYIGKTNPFQTGRIKKILWEFTGRLNFPANITVPANPEWLMNYSATTTVHYADGTLHYFIQNYKNRDSMSMARHVVVISMQTNELLFNRMYFSSEGGSVYPLSMKGEASDQFAQRTGEIFKDRPPVIFGILSASFGCPAIDFIDPAGGSITIRCDNRH